MACRLRARCTRRQLHSLWERNEALRHENTTHMERLEMELKLQRQTQEELYKSKALVGATAADCLDAQDLHNIGCRVGEAASG